MALTKVPKIQYPRRVPEFCGNWGSALLTTSALVDQPTDKVHLVGSLEWADGGSGKTVSEIIVPISAASAPDGNMRVSIQTPRATSGSFSKGGDGTPDRYGEIAAPTTTGAKVVTMTVGSQAYSTGDYIAIVVEDPTLTVGSFVVGGFSSVVASDPAVTLNSGAHASVPNVLLRANDGVYGTLRGAGFLPSNPSVVSYTATSTPYDEYGIVFQVPYRCKVAGVWFHGYPDNRATGLMAAKIYSSPLTSPLALATKSGAAEDLWNTTSPAIGVLWFSSEVTLEANTTYAVGLLATGTTNVNISESDLGTAAYASALPGGTTVYEVARNDSAGPFVQVSASKFLHCGVVITQIDDGQASWVPGTGTTGNTLKILIDPAAQGAGSITGVVFAAPTSGNIVGSKIGEFTSEQFEASLESGQAVLKVPVSSFGGTGLLQADQPVVLVRNSTDTTGIIPATIIQE